MSGTSSHVMRYRRVYSRGIPELAEALSRGWVTEYRAGEIARLSSHRDQKIALAQWTERARQRREGQALAARCLRRYLASHNSQVDLNKACSLIREAVAASRSPPDSHAMARLSNRVLSNRFRESPEQGESIALLLLKLSNQYEWFPNRNPDRKQTPHQRKIFRHEEL